MSEVDLYKKFYDELWKDYKLKKEDIIGWTYAGYFPRDNWEASDLKDGEDFHSKKILGERHWKAIMGDLEMPKELQSELCVCKVRILWNHIIVDDPKKDNPECLILGSECIDKFCGISRNRKCSICDIKINNSLSGKCASCRNKRFCEKCNEVLPKGRRGTFCSDKCQYPNLYCVCGNKKKYDWAKDCLECYWEKKENKN